MTFIHSWDTHPWPYCKTTLKVKPISLKMMKIVVYLALNNLNTCKKVYGMIKHPEIPPPTMIISNVCPSVILSKKSGGNRCFWRIQLATDSYNRKSRCTG
uniref:Uncharacterized protein n=1 Tax=Cacopsylla melanoneura TaxID=428564 RepID=A0A8D8YKE7_9HEMI